MPNDNAAIEILPPSKIFIDCLKPSPTSPILFESSTIQSSKIISAVSDALIPNLFSFFPADNPGVPLSIINAVALFFSPTSPVLKFTKAK